MITFNRLRAKDTFAYKELDFNFTTGLYSIEGKNGSSKSSLFLTLQQGLFNRNAKGSKVDGVNNYITKQPYEITVDFAIGEDLYQVINSRKSGSITITKNGVDISLKRIPDNLALIQEILGCDFALFSDLTYQSKDSTLNLLETTTDKPRKEFVARILNLAEVDAQLEVMKERDKELSGKNGRIPFIKGQLQTKTNSYGEVLAVPDEIETLSIETRLLEIKGDCASLLAEARAFKLEATRCSKEVEIATKNNNLFEEYEWCKNMLAEAAEPPRAKESYQTALKEDEKELSTTTERVKTIKKEYDALKAAMDKGLCPTCGQGVENGKFDEEIGALALLGKTLKASTEDLRKRIEQYQLIIKEWERIEALKTKVELLQAQVADKIDVQTLNKQATAARTLQFELDAKYEEVNKEEKALASEFERRRSNNAARRARVDLNEKVVAANDKLQLEIDADTKELERLEEQVELLKLWQTILGPKGIRVAKIKHFLGVLNSTMKRYSQMITDSRIRCMFFITDTGEIDFTVTDAAKEMPYELWSGGEKARVKLVCLFSIIELSEIMGSVCFNVLGLDEIFDQLDSEGKEGLFKVLTHLKGHNKAIYTIAHSELAMDLVYDSIILAEKMPDSTTRLTQ